MERALILDCNDKIGKEVTICGWVYTRRDHGKITFLDILDRTGIIQAVHSGQIPLPMLHPQDVICVTGKINKRPEKLENKNIPTGSIELEITGPLQILSKAEELPFDMGSKDLDLQLPTLLDWRPLTLRHPKVKNIFKVQQKILEGFRQACQKLDCVEVIVPTIAASSTEGGAEVFKIDYFGHQAYLTQSPQLYKQMMIPVFERIYTITKAYRAEPSITTRHLAEITQMDCEFGFCEFDQLLDLLETVAVGMLKSIDVEPSIAFGKIPRLTLREAQDVILKEFNRDNRKEKDLTPQDEVDLCQWARKNGSDFVTVTHFPTSAKPFYTKPDPKDPQYSLSYDLLFRGVEIMSGSQRINDYKQLVESIKAHGMDPKHFEMYLMAFKFGMPPEGGFSFGLERLTMHVLKLSNIREASLFPRDMERVDIRLTQK